jgi:hypothetical protein
MKRICVLLLAMLALAAAVAAPPAGGSPTAPTGRLAVTAPRTNSGAVLAVRGDTVYVHDTLTWLRNNTIGMSFGPSRRTGYGKVTITGIVKGCPECEWYRTDLDYSNHQPTSPMTANSRHRRGGFCWPWDFDMFSGDSCWNDASSWNWGGIFSAFNDDWHPWNPNHETMLDRISGCTSGAEGGITMKLAGAGAAAAIESSLAPLSITPEGWIVAAIGGCIGNPFH